MQRKETVLLFQCILHLKKEPGNLRVSFSNVFCYHEDCYWSVAKLLVQFCAPLSQMFVF